MIKYMIAATILLGMAVSVCTAQDISATHLPPVNLRGYGEVSGETEIISDADGRKASILTIWCEDDGKAKPTLAKYLSDLSTLPGVSAGHVSAAGTDVPVSVVAGQGIICAVRDEARVFILAAADQEQFAAAYKERLSKVARRPVWGPEVEVPMWLNRWDRYGFRFYYSPFRLPQKDFSFGIPEGTTEETYDFTKEFVICRVARRVDITT